MRLAARRSMLPCLVLALFLLGLVPIAFADLPDPPPPGTKSGPLAGGVGFTGGIIVVEKPQDPIVKDVNKPMGTITCEAISILYNFGNAKSDMGLSVQGPITDAQTQGIIEAVNAHRPPKTVDLGTYVMEGSPTEIRTWTWKSTTFTHTHYEIWAVRSGSPAVNELIGYIDVEKPKMANVVMDSTPCPTPPPAPSSETTPVPGPTFIESFFDVWFPLSDDGYPPFIDYGRVTILSGGGIAAAGLIRPGETVSFLLPPGSYSAQADIGIFGLHFSVTSATYTSPPGATAVLLSVTVQVIEEIVYVLIVVGIIVTALILYGIYRLLSGGQDKWFRSHVVASRKYFEMLQNGHSKPGVEVHMMIPHKSPNFEDPGKALKIAEAILDEFDGNGRSGSKALAGEMKVGLVRTYDAGPFDGSTEALLWQLDGKVIPRGYHLDWDKSSGSNGSGDPVLVDVIETPSGNFPSSLVASIKGTEANFVNDIDSDTPVWEQLKRVFNTIYVSKPGHGKIRRSLTGGYHVETGLPTTMDLRRVLSDDPARVYFSELLREGVGVAGCITFKWKALARRSLSRKGKAGWTRWRFEKPLGWEEELTLSQVLAQPWVSMPQPTRRRQYDEWARGRAA